MCAKAASAYPEPAAAFNLALSDGPDAGRPEVRRRAAPKLLRSVLLSLPLTKVKDMLWGSGLAGGAVGCVWSHDKTKLPLQC